MELSRYQGQINIPFPFPPFIPEPNLSAMTHLHKPPRLAGALLVKGVVADLGAPLVAAATRVRKAARCVSTTASM